MRMPKRVPKTQCVRVSFLMLQQCYKGTKRLTLSLPSLPRPQSLLSCGDDATTRADE